MRALTAAKSLLRQESIRTASSRISDSTRAVRSLKPLMSCWLEEHSALMPSILAVKAFYSCLNVFVALPMEAKRWSWSSTLSWSSLSS